MKKLFFTTVALLVGVFAISQEKKAQIDFSETAHNFGTIVEGTQAAHEFKFTNTGDAPLVLNSVNPSCGCTSPDWPKDPIMPGQVGTIKVVYNSSGRPGSFTKSITVNSNAKNGTVILTIKGVVESKKPAAKSPVKNNKN